MDEVSDYGIATYKRIYGDFTNPSVMAWQDALRDFALTPVFQFNYTKGKNASDSALIIDAMDILYSGKVNGFCLVTSDSDFTKLAIRLREAGMIVIGMGNRRLRILWYRPARHSNSLIYCIRRAWKNRRRTRSFLKLKATKAAEPPAAIRPSDERDTKKAPEAKTKPHPVGNCGYSDDKADNLKDDARLNNVPTEGGNRR